MPGRRPVVFSMQNACGILPLSPCEERAGREPERGELDKKGLLSPALLLFEEESLEPTLRVGWYWKKFVLHNTLEPNRLQNDLLRRERKCDCALKSNLLPNTTGRRPALRPSPEIAGGSFQMRLSSPFEKRPVRGPGLQQSAFSLEIL